MSKITAIVIVMLILLIVFSCVSQRAYQKGVVDGAGFAFQLMDDEQEEQDGETTYQEFQDEQGEPLPPDPSLI